MVSLDPELSKLFLVLMSTRHSSGSQNGTTWANFLKRKLETSFLQHESKIEDSLQFFPDKWHEWKSVFKMRDLDFTFNMIFFSCFYIDRKMYNVSAFIPINVFFFKMFNEVNFRAEN